MHIRFPKNPQTTRTIPETPSMFGPLRGSATSWTILATSGLLALGVFINGIYKTMDADPQPTASSSASTPRSDIPESRRIIERMHAKQLLVDLLLARRLTLVEVAARFRALNMDRPVPIRQAVRKLLPGATEEESACREVISWAEQTLHCRQDPATSARVYELERTLQEHLTSGSLTLPSSNNASLAISDAHAD